VPVHLQKFIMSPKKMKIHGKMKFMQKLNSHSNFRN
jgi:hypothetical protein